MFEFDIHDAAALLGYLTLLVGFAVVGSAGLAFIQSIPARLRYRVRTCTVTHDEPSACNGWPRKDDCPIYTEPVKVRIQRVRPQDFFYELGPDGCITDAVELNEDHTAVVAEYHEKPQVEEYAAYEAAVRTAADRSGMVPHCDSNIMHAPGQCEYCDAYSELQAFRLLHGINFTGQHDPAKLTCPAEVARPLERIERWGGNVPSTPDAYRRSFIQEWTPEDDDEERPVCD